VFFSLAANGCGYVECEFLKKYAVKIAAEPNFVILFLNFCNKAKLQNLAADFEGNHERLPKLLALHIGVVTACVLYSSRHSFNCL